MQQLLTGRTRILGLEDGQDEEAEIKSCHLYNPLQYEKESTMLNTINKILQIPKS
jgi:hypothetical protein